MASSSVVTERYRAALRAIQAATIKDILAIWPAFDPTDIEGTWPPVQQALIAIVQRHSIPSSQLGARYYATARLLAGVVDDFALETLDPPSADQVIPSLVVTGLGRAWSAAKRAAPASVVAQSALAGVIGSATRIVNDSSRQTVQDNIRRDDRSVGYARVASPTACEFCAEIEAEGVIAKTDTLDFAAHDHCSCTSEPVFSG